MFRPLAAAALAMFISSPLVAHEYWLQAEDYTITSQDEMRISIFIGQKFKGNEYPYNPSQLQRYMLLDGNGLQDLEGEIGDKPSIVMDPETPGLNIFYNIATTQLLTYTEPGQFQSFIEHMGLDWVLEQHAERGLPDIGFGEGYTRYVKALVAVDGGAGKDVAIGMRYEIVALANPYTEDVSRGLPVRVLFEGSPLPNRKIEIFRKGSEETEFVWTNSNGLAIIPVTSGTYMINTVQMVIPPKEDQERTGAVWHSLWTSLTFEIP